MSSPMYRAATIAIVAACAIDENTQLTTRFASPSSTSPTWLVAVYSSSAIGVYSTATVVNRSAKFSRRNWKLASMSSTPLRGLRSIVAIVGGVGGAEKLRPDFPGTRGPHRGWAVRRTPDHRFLTTLGFFDLAGSGTSSRRHRYHDAIVRYGAH